ncbi:hypothetical protein KJ781_01125 [Patescibacteria group bacterium]|nr:hypothetical protein [Patescibacteria group bacterium]MBU1448301.1 hypothetical protein [Patescibacteria group bacterium]MBU2612837.1 hypothetical protein [Patescibacteria group bacterium]
MIRDALLRSLAFHRTWGHAPTVAEWISTLDTGDVATSERRPTCVDVDAAVHALEEEGVVVSHGRVAFAEDVDDIGRQRIDEAWAPRKRRAVRVAVRLLSRLSSVRFVALCNTAALGHARDNGDLDLFVVVRQGTIFSTRLLAAALFEALGRRPRLGRERDAVCLSYFVTDDSLDLSPHMLLGEDPYFRYWFLSFVPFYDDGIGVALWDANAAITARHPCARRWMVPPDIRIETPRLRLPVPRSTERLASVISTRAFPTRIRGMMNVDTRVMVSPHVLKLHVDDRREDYRNAYEFLCRSKRLSP